MYLSFSQAYHVLCFCLCASVAAQLMSGFALLRCSGDGSGGWQFTIHMYKFQKRNKQEKRSPHHSGGGGNMDDHAHVCTKRKKKKKKDLLLLPSSLYTTTL
uniref:Putative secreted protein n=1 Tax=Ixodes ricinus TaxID=34613 RepID=A0A6B0UEW2_IXORI